MIKRNGRLISKKYNEYLVSTLAMSASLYLAAIVDNIMVGNILGAQALAAVNLTSPLVYVKNIVFSIFIYGGNTLAAMYKGRRRGKDADKAFTFSLLLGIVVSSAVAAAGIFLAAPTASALSQGGGLYRNTLEYIIPLWASAPFIVLNSGAAAYVRTDGMKTLASLLPIVSNVINLIFDYVFMAVFGWGVAGAGWATVFGYAVGSLLLVFYFTSKKRTVHFVLVSFKDIKILLAVLQTGLPTALIHMCNFARTAFINAVILSASGTVGIQTVTICLSAFNIALIFINGASTTVMPICGALFGEGDAKGVKYALKTALIITEVMCFAVLLVFELFPAFIGRLFVSLPPETEAVFTSAFRIFSLCIPFYGLAYIIRAFYQSTKQRFAASLFTVIEGAVFIIPMIYIFSGISENLMWLSFTLAEALSLVIFCAVMQIIAKKKNKKNFLAIEATGEELFDGTIFNNMESAEEVSQKIIDSCLRNNIDKSTANALGVTAEELTVNAVRYAYNKRSEIDINLRRVENTLILRIRDNGIMFNPEKQIENSYEKISGLLLVSKLTPDISYSRMLGFNVTVVKASI